MHFIIEMNYALQKKQCTVMQWIPYLTCSRPLRSFNTPFFFSFAGGSVSGHVRPAKNISPRLYKRVPITI